MCPTVVVQRKREKRPLSAGSRRPSSKNAEQIMNMLDKLVRLHVAKIGGRTLVTSPTAMQVLRFVTLIDATGREHPILVQCCSSFEASDAACVRAHEGVADGVCLRSNSKRC